MQLQLSTWPEVEAYLEHSDGVIVPIGSTEQHGPTGLIGTDALCPELLAREAGRRAGILIAPTLAIGMAQHHLGFPGSLTLRPSTLIALLRDLIGSLSVHGFRRIYLLNGHGGNVATVQAAFAEVHAEASLAGRCDQLRLKLANWYQGPRVLRLSRELFGDAEGSHATPSELSLTWHAHPERAQVRVLEPRRAPRGGFGDASDYRQRFPDGRIGSDPSLASVAAGGQLFEAGVEDTLEDYTAFLASG